MELTKGAYRARIAARPTVTELTDPQLVTLYGSLNAGTKIRPYTFPEVRDELEARGLYQYDLMGSLDKE